MIRWQITNPIKICCSELSKHYSKVNGGGQTVSLWIILFSSTFIVSTVCALITTPCSCAATSLRAACTAETRNRTSLVCSSFNSALTARASASWKELLAGLSFTALIILSVDTNAGGGQLDWTVSVGLSEVVFDVLQTASSGFLVSTVLGNLGSVITADLGFGLRINGCFAGNDIGGLGAGA